MKSNSGILYAIAVYFALFTAMVVLMPDQNISFLILVPVAVAGLLGPALGRLVHGHRSTAWSPILYMLYVTFPFTLITFLFEMESLPYLLLMALVACAAFWCSATASRRVWKTPTVVPDSTPDQVTGA